MEIPRSFWNFNIGHVCGIVVFVFGLGVIYQTVQSDGKALKSDILQLRHEHEALVVKVDQMDERGTHASQQGIYKESQASIANERRLSELEKEWHDIGPKVERIDVNLSWLLKSQGVSVPQR